MIFNALYNELKKKRNSLSQKKKKKKKKNALVSISWAFKLAILKKNKNKKMDRIS